MLSWFKQMMWRLVKQWRKCIAPRLLLVEASLYLLMARLALKLFSFRRLIWVATLPSNQPEITGDARARARKEVQWAIKTIFLRLPGRTACFTRAIAAQAMLRRRGVSTTLYYGAATLPARGLTAHVWLQDGKEGIVGYYVGRRYHILARYPDVDESEFNLRRTQ